MNAGVMKTVAVAMRRNYHPRLHSGNATRGIGDREQTLQLLRIGINGIDGNLVGIAGFSIVTHEYLNDKRGVTPVKICLAQRTVLANDLIADGGKR